MKWTVNRILTGILLGTALMSVMMSVLSCSSVKSILAVEGGGKESRMISNPFGTYYANGKEEGRAPIVLRTRKGDRSVEVELPHDQAMTDFVLPVAPAFKEGGRHPASAASEGGANNSVTDDSYKDRASTMTDQEIISTMPQGTQEDVNKRNEIESSLGLMAAEEVTPAKDKSYLASLDNIKQLFKIGRYEVALLEVDAMIHQYQTDPKLYEMRGTLLDRLGRLDLAFKSWNQAMRLDPKNLALRKFVERRQQNRSVASP